jgi:hypothetical protein
MDSSFGRRKIGFLGVTEGSFVEVLSFFSAMPAVASLRRAIEL